MFCESDISWSLTANWIQAIGSILAIIASAAFAIWVPYFMQSRAEQAVIERAIRHAVLAASEVTTAYTSLAKDEVGEKSVFDLLLARTERAANELLRDAPRSAFHTKGIAAIMAIEAHLLMLPAIVAKRTRARLEPGELDPVIEELRTAADSLAGLNVRKEMGVWCAVAKDEKRYRAGRRQPAR